MKPLFEDSNYRVVAKDGVGILYFKDEFIRNLGVCWNVFDPTHNKEGVFKKGSTIFSIEVTDGTRLVRAPIRMENVSLDPVFADNPHRITPEMPVLRFNFSKEDLNNALPGL